jgi:hypothetical protein
VLARAWEAGTGFRLAVRARRGVGSSFQARAASSVVTCRREQIAEGAREEATERRRRTIRLLCAAIEA